MSEYGIANKKNIRVLAFELANNFVEFNYCEPIFLCVGNSNVVGDLFGPMCGEILSKKYKINNVVGNLTHNITSKNLNSIYNSIKQNFPFNKIVVIDSALSHIESVGNVKFLPYGCIPASSRNSEIMGNASILANVNVLNVSGLMFLKSVKYKMVKVMAEFVCEAIMEALKLKEIYKSTCKNYNTKICNN